MTVSAASLTSPAASQFESRHPAPQSHAPESPSSSHSHTFSHLLQEGMKKNKEESTTTNSSKPRKADGQTGNNQDVTADPSAPAPVTKPPVTGQFGWPTGQSGADQVENDPNTKPAIPNDAPETGAALDNAVSAQGGTLQSGAALKDSGSILMAILMQSRAGGMTVLRQADSPAADLREEDAKAKRGPDLSKGLASPLSFPVQTGVPNEVSGTASKPEGASSIQSGSSSPDAAPLESTAPEAPPAAMPGHLAFALRLNATLNASPLEAAAVPPASTQAALPTQAAQSTVVAGPGASIANMPALSMAPGADSEKKEHPGSDSKDGGNALQAVDLPVFQSNDAKDSPAPANEAAAPSHAPELDERYQEGSTEPVRNVHMQVVGDDNRRVDIRLMDRAGELRVSVKSGDSNLNQTLQAKMPELTSRLESARYQTEVWMPDSQNQGSASQSNVDADGQRQGKQEQPHWVEDLEGSTPGTIERKN